MAYQPARYRYCHFYAAHQIQRHFRNVKKGEEAGNLFDADVEFWAQLIYDSPENRAMQTPEQAQVLFNQLQLKYWQSLCRAIEIKMAPKRKKKDPPTKVTDFCLVKGTKVRHATRGPGEVIALDWNEKRGKPVFVQFENGEVHHYSMESAAKLEAVVLWQQHASVCVCVCVCVCACVCVCVCVCVRTGSRGRRPYKPETA